jgi:diadenosine tetraphosphate (Ap4A) HIT family hydrolase
LVTYPPYPGVVADFAGLNEIGVVISGWSNAWKKSGAERVYLATIGHSFDHRHVHLLPRWLETPPEVPWHSVDDLSGARRVRDVEATKFVVQLRFDNE